MDTELQRKINDKLATLPEDVRNAISSADVGNKLNSIAKKHGLLLDQANDLYLEVSLVMIGLEPIIDLVDNISSNIGIDKDKAALIAIDINNEIFVSIREGLKKLNTETDSTRTDTPSLNNLNKDQILAEIENPTPVAHPISIVDQTLPGPAVPREIINTPKPAQASSPAAANTKESVASDFIGNKLTETVSLPSKKYSVDPYREPVS